jgi:hypothetical protein
MATKSPLRQPWQWSSRTFPKAILVVLGNLCCAGNIWTGASPPRSIPGNASAMPQVLASNECCSHPRKARVKIGRAYAEHVSIDKSAKSHNHRAAVLVALARHSDRGRANCRLHLYEMSIGSPSGCSATPRYGTMRINRSFESAMMRNYGCDSASGAQRALRPPRRMLTCMCRSSRGSLGAMQCIGFLA